MSGGLYSKVKGQRFESWMSRRLTEVLEGSVTVMARHPLDVILFYGGHAYGIECKRKEGAAMIDAWWEQSVGACLGSSPHLIPVVAVKRNRSPVVIIQGITSNDPVVPEGTLVCNKFDAAVKKYNYFWYVSRIGKYYSVMLFDVWVRSLEQTLPQRVLSFTGALT